MKTESIPTDPFDLSQGPTRVPCDAEGLFTALQLACILRGTAFFRKDDKDLRTHLAKAKNWAAAQTELGNLEAPLDFWKAAKREFHDPPLRMTAYKLWIMAALSPDSDLRRATPFIDKLREIWELPWLEGLAVTQTMLKAGRIKGLEDSLLQGPDRQVVLALISMLVHADGMMHISEVTVFRRCVDLLDLNPAELGFLKDFGETKGLELAKRLGPQKFAASLPHLFRTVLADGAPRPSERETLAALIEASAVPAASLAAAVHLAALERGVHLDLS